MRPISSNLQNAIGSYQNGNFGLYFNKFVEINENDNFKKFIDKEPNPKQNIPAVEGHEVRLEKVYNTINKNIINEKLRKKHNDQNSYLVYYKDKNYKIYELKATLTSPLIVGIGETNPGEVGMVFDRTLGIPYIPASSIKGVTRFAHLLSLVESGEYKDHVKTDKDGNLFFDQNDDWTKVVELFGGDRKNNKGEKESMMGQVVFLDAYPDKTPELHIDIMNPHYVKYYEDKKTPPADYCEPRPIKFLTVAKGTTFIFRFIAPDELFELAKKALEKALFVEGIGAKTAVGYGRFKKYDEQTNSNNTTNTVIIKKTDNAGISKLKAGMEIIGSLMDEKTKKGGWKFQSDNYPDIKGTILNSNTLPQESKAGDKVKVIIKSVSGSNSGFDYKS